MKLNDRAGVFFLCRTIAILAMAAGGAPALALEGAAGAPAEMSATAVTGQAIGDRYPAGSIRSYAQAEQAVRHARRERLRIDALLAQESLACRDEFFMTACLLDAKERRSIQLQRLKAIEVEANVFKRQARVDARDRALAARRRTRDEAAGG